MRGKCERVGSLEREGEVTDPTPRKVRVEHHSSSVVNRERECYASVDGSERRRLDQLGASECDNLVANVLVERLTGFEEGLGIGFQRVGVDFGG